MASMDAIRYFGCYSASCGHHFMRKIVWKTPKLLPMGLGLIGIQGSGYIPNLKGVVWERRAQIKLFLYTFHCI